MKNENEIPAFIRELSLAERSLLSAPLYGSGVLYQAYKLLLREMLSSAKIEVGTNLTVLKISQVFLPQIDFPANFNQELVEIVQHHNMMAHVHPTMQDLSIHKGKTAIFLDDLEKIRKQALWYLRDFPKGPRMSTESAMELLRSGSSKFPKFVFISYAREDQAQASNLYRALQRRGHEPWMDKQGLIPGQEWESVIRKAIGRADYFVALMSSKSVTKRGFIQKEIRFALDVLGEIPPGRIFFIPARLEPCDVPDIIRHLHWVDLQKDEDYLQIFRAIEND
jgi:hypothetical protein